MHNNALIYCECIKRPTSSFYVALLLIFMPGTGAERLGSDQKTVLIQYSVQTRRLLIQYSFQTRRLFSFSSVQTRRLFSFSSVQTRRLFSFSTVFSTRMSAVPQYSFSRQTLDNASKLDP